MSLRNLAEDHNKICFLPVNGRRGGCWKSSDSTSLPTDDMPRVLHLPRNKQTTKLDLACLAKFGRFNSIELCLPFFVHGVSAGYPSDVEDPFKRHLDLSRYVIRHPKTTYYFKAVGYSMIKAGINHNDLLVVDTALKPKHRDIVIAVLNGELTLKRLNLDGSEVKLLSANPDYPSITVTKEMRFFVQGVVTTVIWTFNPLPYDNHFKDISYPHF